MDSLKLLIFCIFLLYFATVLFVIVTVSILEMNLQNVSKLMMTLASTLFLLENWLLNSIA